MEFALNDAPILSATIDMPLLGAWTADVVVDCDDTERVTGTVRLENADGSWILKGTARMGGVDAGGKAVVCVVGGTGGLANKLAPKFFANVPASTVVGDAVKVGVEALSSGSDPLQTTFEYWTRLDTTVSNELNDIVGALGFAWRARPDGSIWIGSETWPKSKTSYDYLEDYPGESRVVIGPDAPTLSPGTVFLDRRVVHVTHAITPGSLRTEVFYER